MKRKECEKIHWYNRGFENAMNGKRLDSDSEIQACLGVEALIRHDQLDQGFKAGMAKYCLKDTAYQKGREGVFFNFEFCGQNTNALRNRHTEGVLAFCDSKNGYRVGTRGYEYKNICPKSLEAKFLSQYRKGRIVYLESQIESHQSQIRELVRSTRDMKRKQRNLQSQLRYLPRNRVKVIERRSKDKIVRYEEDDSTNMERDRLNWEIRRINGKIQDNDRLESRLRQKIGSFKSEIRSLKFYPPESEL